jgi:pre-mRNA-splicing factor ATP-dependent RNA helicase DHX15/PRP43
VPSRNQKNDNAAAAMETLRRNKTTAAQAIAIEDGNTNTLTRPPRPYRQGYKTLLQQRRDLPISSKRQAFLTKYQNHQVMVLVSPTGSGKTTQAPTWVLFDEYESGLIVACTHPRRAAATSMARRVAQELDVDLAQEVGYGIGQDTMSSEATRLKFVTDAYLLNEALRDPRMSRYSTIIVDDAHERTVASDLLLSLLKKAMAKNPGLKVIVMSATINADKFLGYFPGAALFEVKGHTHPVEVFHLMEDEVPDVHVATIATIGHIVSSSQTGDILVFSPGEAEIERLCNDIRKFYPDLSVMPLHSTLPSEQQELALRPQPKERKCIVATNIAETSLTIPGIGFVIDCGLTKQMAHNPRLRMMMLQTVAISKAAANQRAGRAGRTRPGQCYRLYTEDDYEYLMQATTPPAILLEDTTEPALKLIRAGCPDLRRFDWIDPPSPENLFSALENLEAW